MMCDIVMKKFETIVCRDKFGNIMNAKKEVPAFVATLPET